MVEVPRETERSTGAVPGNQRYELSAYSQAVPEPYGWMLCTDKGGKVMEIKGKVHCFFEQSGTFKREFIKLGIPAEDYDIQDNFGQTDHKIDLFAEIENAYRGGKVSLIQLVAMI